MNLREREQFPNWSLALEFLKRSPVNFLVSKETPPDTLSSPLNKRMVLWGVAGPSECLFVPEWVTLGQIDRMCAALVRDHPMEVDFASVRSTNFMAFLNAFTQTLAGKFNLREVAKAITDKTCLLFGAEGASILLPTDDGRMRFAMVTAETEEIRARLDQMLVPADTGITGWVVTHKTSILMNDANRDLLYDQRVDEKTQFRTREVLASPILVGENLIGILQVVSRRANAFQKSDLQLVELVAAIIASFMDKAKLYEEQLKLTKMTHELDIARQLQLAMMPQLPALIGPFILHGESRQIGRVGGDYWDVIPINDDESLMIIGDVSGHGLSAALIMSAIRTASRALLPSLTSPKALIEPLNLLIHNEFGVKGHYATMIFIVINHETHMLSMLRAGHEYAVIRTATGLARVNDQGSWPLGLFPFRQEDIWTEQPFTAEDRLYLYTDGTLDGLPGDEVRLEEVLNSDDTLEGSIREGGFFSRMTEHHQWKPVDDATILQLAFDELE